MAKGKGKKGGPSKGQKKPKKARPVLQMPGAGYMDSTGVTPDVDYPYRSHRYPQPTTFDVTEFYIPMKVYPFNTFRDLSQMSKDNVCYSQVQDSPLFAQSISDDQIIDDIFSDEPEKSNKLMLLAEAGNGKSTIARRLVKLIQEKQPEKLAFFLDLKEIGKKKECSLPEMILPEEYQKNSKGDKKNAAQAMKCILNNPHDCLFIIDSLEDFEENEKVISALVSGESESLINIDHFQEDLGGYIDKVLPTWQWINELLIGSHLNSGAKKARIILMSRPETIAYYKTPNPYYHKRPGLGWNTLNEDVFDASGFCINCIFGVSVSDMRDNFPSTFIHREDIHRNFIEFIEEQPSFAYFCRKPFQMHLFYDMFHDVTDTDRHSY